MTNDERIEAAATAMHPDWRGTHEVYQAAFLEKARAVLMAAYPELHPSAGQQPTHWLAPWEASEKMLREADDAVLTDEQLHAGPFEMLKAEFAAMRSVYLSGEPKC